MADAEAGSTTSNTECLDEKFKEESLEPCTKSADMIDKGNTSLVPGSGNDLKNEEDSQDDCRNSSDNSEAELTKETTGHDEKDIKESENGKEDKTQTIDQTNYELKDGKYYYTDSTSGQKYVYDESAGQWVASDSSQEVTTDEEGRTYYYAQNMHLCRDREGNVFYLNENNEWVPWGSGGESDSNKKDPESSKWYFHQGDDMFYRDKVSNVVYKFNKDKNEWEVYEGRLKRKRPRIDPEEEFDTDEESDEEENNGTAPPGAQSDPNIEYDGSVYTKRDPGDNMVYEWDVVRRAWFPKLDEDFMAIYQLSYGFNPDGTKNENPLKFDDDEELEEPVVEEDLKIKGKAAKKKATWFEMDETTNTKVYVSNLPECTSEEEFLEIMQKCGMIVKDAANNKYKIRMYRDGEGNFKGDALCTYIKRESVELALQILDGYQVGNQTIHVEQAKFQLKGDYNPKLKPKKKSKKELEKLQKKQEKLFDWRPEPMRGQRQKHERTVIIRNVFTPKEFETHLEKMLVHKEAIRNQCLTFGEISKFDLHDLHPDGVVQVTFSEVEAADMCVATLHNRLYEGRILRVETWDGKEKFRIEETDEQREERLKKWDKFLEGKDKK